MHVHYLSGSGRLPNSGPGPKIKSTLVPKNNGSKEEWTTVNRKSRKNSPISPVSPNLQYLLDTQPQLLPPGTSFSFENQTAVNNSKYIEINNGCNNRDNGLSTSNHTTTSVIMEIETIPTGSCSKSKVTAFHNNSLINSQLSSVTDTSTRFTSRITILIVDTNI